MAFVHRVAKQDLEIKGQQLRKGQIVFLGLAAANHDEEIFDAPDQFDITRKGNKHFYYGPTFVFRCSLGSNGIKNGFASFIQTDAQFTSS